MPYSGPSSTLVSVDPSNLTPPMTVLGGSPAVSAPEDNSLLHPTPYLVSRGYTTSGSQPGSKTHMRELASAANMPTGTSDLRATATSPSKLDFAAEGQNTGNAGNGNADGDGARDGDILRLEAGGAVPPSHLLGLGFEDTGTSDIASNSGEGTLPPPYTRYLGGGPDEDA